MHSISFLTQARRACVCTFRSRRDNQIGKCRAACRTPRKNTISRVTPRVLAWALACIPCLLFTLPVQLSAQEIASEEVTYVRAKVIEVIDSQTRPIPGLGITEERQTIRAKFLDGEHAGEEITIENDYLMLDVGDIFYAMGVTNNLDGTAYWSVGEPYRMMPLYVLAGLFLILLLFFGGLPGVRGLMSLAAGIFLIVALLLPGILRGYSPLLLSIVVTGVIVTIGSYVTHGFRRTTSAAILAMLIVVFLSGMLAFWITHAAKLTGFFDETAVYLNFNTRGIIDFQGLLLGSILIGLLGVLYDIAIGQAVAVEELLSANPNLSRKELYKKALRIGREHVGALVNTLAIAYVGTSLPLLLMFTSSDYAIQLTLNREIFASEIARILVGAIGIILTTPIATGMAVVMLTQGHLRWSAYSSKY